MEKECQPIRLIRGGRGRRLADSGSFLRQTSHPAALPRAAAIFNEPPKSP